MHRRFKLVAAGLAAVLIAGMSSACEAHLFGPATTVHAATQQPGATTKSGAVKLPTPTATFSGYSSPDRQQLSASNARPKGFTTAPAGTGVERYFNQKIDWQSCGARYQCARVKTPLDWLHPEGQAITLAVKQLKSSAAHPLGSLFINPGGPGGSAQDYLDHFDPTGLEDWNIVAMDPRGSGESTPVVCGNGHQTDAFLNVDGAPTDQAGREALVAATKEFAQRCHDHSGALLDHINSIETEYDFDMLRQLVGDAKFNYLGVSYGTWLGALYAELYPHNVGHMVLDSPVNITDDQSVTQAQGFEKNLDNYAAWCAEQNCFLGATKDAVIASIKKYMGDLDKSPLRVGNRALTKSLAVSGIVIFFYSGDSGYKTLTLMLEQAFISHNGSYLLQAADLMNDRNKDGSYGTMMYAFPAIMCADAGDKGVADAWKQWADDSRQAPVMGPLLGPGLTCPLWAAKPAPQVKITATDAPPILIVSNSGDPATPHQYALWMNKIMAGSVLVTRQAVGHGAYEAGSKCVDDKVRTFLNDGTMPGQSIVCADG